jgi:hypothetical protein
MLFGMCCCNERNKLKSTYYSSGTSQKTTRGLHGHGLWSRSVVIGASSLHLTNPGGGKLIDDAPAEAAIGRGMARCIHFMQRDRWLSIPPEWRLKVCSRRKESPHVSQHIRYPHGLATPVLDHSIIPYHQRHDHLCRRHLPSHSQIPPIAGQHSIAW